MYIPEFNHLHIKGMTCQLIKETKRGWQVLQQDKPNKKPKTQFYDGIYFSKEKGVWKKISIQ